jgi:regulator of cell morphogenesis and NO signaling
MDIASKSLQQLVEENYIFGSILHSFGIEFFRYPLVTLEKVCAEKRMSTLPITRELESSLQEKRIAPMERVASYPVDMVIDYLKHNHRLFMRKRLPYMAHLVKNIDTTQLDSAYQEIICDMKIAFPIFAEDFVHHIFEEESLIFDHIMLLDDASYGKTALGKVFMAMQKNSVMDFAAAHVADDDDMRGIRELTDNYHTKPNAPLVVKVLFAELQSFEQELKEHADIENKILMARAIRLEAKVKEILKVKSVLN